MTGFLALISDLNMYRQKSIAMPQIPIENNDRMSLRTAVSAAREVIDKNELVELTQRDSLHVLDLLKKPPAPNEKLMAAAFALPK